MQSVAVIGGVNFIRAPENASYICVQKDAQGNVLDVTEVKDVSLFIHPDGHKYVFDKQAPALSANGNRVEYYGGDGTLLIGHVDEVTLPDARGNPVPTLNPKGVLRTWTAAPESAYTSTTSSTPGTALTAPAI
jgi:hypothetical protein